MTAFQSPDFSIPARGAFNPLLWALAVVTVLIVGTTLTWFAYDEYNRTIDQEYRALESNSHIAEVQLSNLLRNIEQLLNNIAREQKTLSTAQRPRYDSVLAERMEQFPEIRSLVVINARGRVELTANPKLTGFDASGRDYFVAHQARPLVPNFYISRPFRTATGGDMSIAFSVAMYDSSKNFQGMVVAGFSPKYFEGVLTQIRPSRLGSIATLFNHHGDMIYRIPDPEQYSELRLAGAKVFEEYIKANKTITRQMGESAADGEKRLYVIARVGTSDLSVNVASPASDVLKPWRFNVALRALIFLLTALITLGLAWIAQRRLRERERAETALYYSLEEFRISLDTTLDGYWKMGIQGNLLDVNPAYCHLSGFTREELLGMRITSLEAKESVAKAEQRLRHIVSSGRDQFESRHRRKDGSVWDVEVSVTYSDVEGGRFLAFFRDITERKQAEEALRKKEERLRSVFEAMSEGFSVQDVICDEGGKPSDLRTV